MAYEGREHEAFDLVAVGAGFAGLMAAVRAQALERAALICCSAPAA